MGFREFLIFRQLPRMGDWWDIRNALSQPCTSKKSHVCRANAWPKNACSNRSVLKHREAGSAFYATHFCKPPPSLICEAERTVETEIRSERSWIYISDGSNPAFWGNESPIYSFFGLKIAVILSTGLLRNQFFFWRERWTQRLQKFSIWPNTRKQTSPECSERVN